MFFPHTANKLFQLKIYLKFETIFEFICGAIELHNDWFSMKPESVFLVAGQLGPASDSNQIQIKFWATLGCQWWDNKPHNSKETTKIDAGMHIIITKSANGAQQPDRSAFQAWTHARPSCQAPTESVFKLSSDSLTCQGWEAQYVRG